MAVLRPQQPNVRPLWSNRGMLERYAAGAPAVAKSLVPAPLTTDSVPPLDATVPRSAKLIEIFIADVPEILAKIDHAVAHVDPNAIAVLAHKLKGGCLSFGAEPMAAEAPALDASAKAGELAPASAHVAELNAQLTRHLAAQRRHPTRTTSHPIRAPALGA